MRRTFAVFILVLAFAASSAAQTLFQGRIDATVLDAQGNAVPGVMVEIAGPTPMSQTTDQSGEAHFLNLSPGAYSVSAALSGFNTYRNTSVEVAAGPEPRATMCRTPGDCGVRARCATTFLIRHSAHNDGPYHESSSRSASRSARARRWPAITAHFSSRSISPPGRKRL